MRIQERFPFVRDWENNVVKGLQRTRSRVGTGDGLSHVCGKSKQVAWFSWNTYRLRVDNKTVTLKWDLNTKLRSLCLTLHQALTNDFQKVSFIFTTPHMKNLKFIKVK